MAHSIPCPSCDGLPVVQFERAGRHATGAHAVCAECNGEGVARCFWKLTPNCTRIADRLLEGEPSCAHCFATSVLDEIADEVARERGISVTGSEAAQ